MHITKLTSLLTVVLLSASIAAAQSPYTEPDGSWITLGGTVADAGAHAFELDYGEGIITVEMDDWDWYPDAAPLMDGDHVTVSGRVDDDFYEVATIEASSVFVDELNTYYYANPADEEDFDGTVRLPLGEGSQFSVRGEITSKSGREFTVDTDGRQVKVDTVMMGYNPLDDLGYQQLDVGDRVYVTGELDLDIFEKREIMADTIITLREDKGASESRSGSASE